MSIKETKDLTKRKWRSRTTQLTIHAHLETSLCTPGAKRIAWGFIFAEKTETANPESRAFPRLILIRISRAWTPSVFSGKGADPNTLLRHLLSPLCRVKGIITALSIRSGSQTVRSNEESHERTCGKYNLNNSVLRPLKDSCTWWYSWDKDRKINESFGLEGAGTNSGQASTSHPAAVVHRRQVYWRSLIVHKRFRSCCMNYTVHLKKQLSLLLRRPGDIRLKPAPSNQSILYRKRHKTGFLPAGSSSLPLWHHLVPVRFLCCSWRGCDWEGAAFSSGAGEERVFAHFWNICAADKQHHTYSTKRPRGTTSAGPTPFSLFFFL